MSKVSNVKNQGTRKYLREFVNSIVNKDYAAANANLSLAVKEKIKAKVANILEENP